MLEVGCKNENVCDHCGFSFTTKKELELHVVTLGIKAKECIYCGINIKGVKNMKYHRNECHDEKSMSILPNPKRRNKGSEATYNTMQVFYKHENMKKASKEPK